MLADTWTDAVLVMHDGRVVLERYFGGMREDMPHLLMSISKSIVGCVTGVLAEQGRLDIDAPIARYVPEIAGSGYDGATCAAPARHANRGRVQRGVPEPRR